MAKLWLGITNALMFSALLYLLLWLTAVVLGGCEIRSAQ